MKVDSVVACTVMDVPAYVIQFKDTAAAMVVRKHQYGNGSSTPLDLFETTAYALADHIYNLEHKKDQ